MGWFFLAFLAFLARGNQKDVSRKEREEAKGLALIKDD